MVVVLNTGPRVTYILSKHSTTELQCATFSMRTVPMFVN